MESKAAAIEKTTACDAPCHPIFSRILCAKTDPVMHRRKRTIGFMLMCLADN
jgi:hypothetical protein